MSAIRGLLLASGFLVVPLDAGHPDEFIGCTAIGIDGAASADGSAFAGMNADSGAADYRLTYNPARSHEPGAMRPIYTFNLSYPRFVGYGRSDMYHPSRPDDPLYVPCGHIPEVSHTYGYYEAAEPLMNEEGLSMGESSCSAMLQNRFPDDKTDVRDVPVGLLDTVTMMQLALERCATARCAVETMGQLAEEFGFVPTPGEPTVGSVQGRPAYDDAGEAYTIADKKGEAWVFHVLGGVSGVTKSVWAAQKVPKGHIVVVPNEFIIQELPEEPTEDCLFSKSIHQAAVAAKLWDGKGKLHFTKAFGPEPTSFESPTGATPIPLYGSLRRWGLYDLAAPSMKLPFRMSDVDFPFSVKVEKTITHRDVMKYMRYQYEGTEFDLTQGMLAGPFGNPYRLEGGPSSGQIPRGIAITRTLYGFIGQTGPGESMGWFAMDCPTTSVYVPLSPRSSAVTSRYETGNQAEFSRHTAAWAFNFVNNFAQLNYALISKGDVYPAIESWQDTIDEEHKQASEWSDAELSSWQASVQERVVAGWWEMSDLLIMKYNDGRTNVPKVGVSWAYPAWYAEAVGFSNDVHPVWSTASNVPPKGSISSLSDYVAPVFTLPTVFDFATEKWQFAPLQDSLSSAAPRASPMFLLGQCLVTLMALVVGIVIGRGYERRQTADQAESYKALA